jgi:hypothetical protein
MLLGERIDGPDDDCPLASSLARLDVEDEVVWARSSRRGSMRGSLIM